MLPGLCCLELAVNTTSCLRGDVPTNAYARVLHLQTGFECFEIRCEFAFVHLCCFLPWFWHALPPVAAILHMHVNEHVKHKNCMHKIGRMHGTVGSVIAARGEVQPCSTLSRV
jgi:hypothetical protein